MSPLRFSGSSPDRLMLAPVDLRTSDAFIAKEMASGRFPLADKVIETDSTTPFEIALPHDEFFNELHGFRWLRHLRASDDDDTKFLAQSLVSSWMVHHAKRLKGPAWELDIVSKRLISWLSHSPVILAEADHDFYKRFMANIALHVRFLRCSASSHRNPTWRLQARIAVAMASLCLPSSNTLLRSAANALDEELENQIFADGGHVSRNPQVVLNILSDLLPLRQTYINLGSALPLSMLPAIDRMFVALRFFRHSSGEIALFNGATHASANFLMSILQNDETGAQSPVNLPQSGFTRLEAGKSIVLMDNGYSPKGTVSRKAHAGCLSFEFSNGANRLIVNSGAPRFQISRFGEFARLTAAHSALVIENTSSSRVSDSDYLGSIFVHGPKEIILEDLSNEEHMGIRASHDGYLSSYGLVHQRQVRLERDGKSLSGLDILETPDSVKKSTSAGRDIDIRFHIHPSVQLEQLTDGSILLNTHDGDRWIFNATVKPKIEQDIFFADVLGARRSEQIFVSFNASEHHRIAWILKAVEVS
ncbi:MAG: heparinase II/III family protein [Lentilitoribacter sp.]